MRSHKCVQTVVAEPKENAYIVIFGYKYEDNIRECENLSAKLWTKCQFLKTNFDGCSLENKVVRVCIYWNKKFLYQLSNFNDKEGRFIQLETL